MTKVTGIQGVGKAGVFNQSPDIWRFVNNVQRDQAIAQKAKVDEINRRDKLFEDLDKFDPGKTWEPFYEQVNSYVQSNIRDRAAQMLDAGRTSEEVRRELSRQQGQAKTMVNKINWHKEQYGGAGEAIAKDDEMNYSAAKSALNDIYFDGMQAKNVAVIDDSDIDKRIFNNPKLYNVENVMKNFMKGLPEQLNTKYSDLYSEEGKEYAIEETKTKLGYQTDAEGNYIMDERTGRPKIGMTDDVYLTALENPKIKNMIDAYVGPNAPKQEVKDFLTGYMETFDPNEYKRRKQVAYKYSDQDKLIFGGYGVPVKNLQNRYDLLHQVTHGNKPDILGSVYSGFDNIEVSYEYGNQTSKDTPTGIVIKYPTSHIKSEGDGEITMESLLAGAGGKDIKTEVLPLVTEADKLATMNKLSRIFDGMAPANQKMGEDFAKFVDDQKKKKKSTGRFYKRPTDKQDNVELELEE